MALARTFGLINSPALAINFDTGNAFLSGNDPHEWLADIIDDVVHVHAKDISQETADLYRGKVKGMLGCACGAGVIDWERIVETCRSAAQDIVLSIECASIDDAEQSFLVAPGPVSGFLACSFVLQLQHLSPASLNSMILLIIKVTTKQR